MSEMYEPYTLADGITELTDKEHSRIMYTLVELHPEISRDYTWDDIGMASSKVAEAFFKVNK